MLGLTALTVRRHDKPPGEPVGGFGAQPPANQVQARVDPRRCAGGGQDASSSRYKTFGIDVDRRKALPPWRARTPNAWLPVARRGAPLLQAHERRSKGPTVRAPRACASRKAFSRRSVVARHSRQLGTTTASAFCRLRKRREVRQAETCSGPQRACSAAQTTTSKGFASAVHRRTRCRDRQVERADAVRRQRRRRGCLGWTHEDRMARYELGPILSGLGIQASRRFRSLHE